MVCSLTRVSAQLVEKILAAAEAEDDDALSKLIDEAQEADIAGTAEGKPSGYLDKAWDGLGYLYDRAGLPIDLVHGGDPVSIDGVIASIWDTAQVRATAKAVREMPFDRLAEHFDPADMKARNVYCVLDDEYVDYLRSSHEELVRYVEWADADGSAVLVTIS